MADVTIDTSELDKLNALLQRAADRTAKERKRALDKAAKATFDEAHANASSFTKASTGELAESLQVDGTDLTRRVGSSVRQAFFLEFGSPNTGGPNPWLTEPAERASKSMLDELSDAAKPW